MGFGKAVTTGFIKYFNFSDRACRSEFWYWTLFVAILGIGAALIDLKLDTQFISAAFDVATFIPSLAISVRRLHDLDEPGWWVLISFIPILGGIALLIWFVIKGTDGPNQYGPDPLAANSRLPDQQSGAPA